MKKIIASAFSFFLLVTTTAQTANRFEPSLTNYYNNFQNFTNSTPDADSAFFYLQKLASDKKFIFYFTDIVHNSLAQSFAEKGLTDKDSLVAKAAFAMRLLGKQILDKMAADTSALLKQAAGPLRLLTNIQDAGKDQNEQAAFANNFMEHQLTTDLLFNQRSGRYGLMIYQLISNQPTLKSLAEKLLNKLNDLFKSNQKTFSDSLPRAALDERAWYRFMYATTNYFKAGNTNDKVDKMQLLKNAFDFSPDLADRNHAAAYFYDKVLLFDDETKNFKDDYLALLIASAANKSVVLSTLLQTALIEPGFKTRLAQYYGSNKPTSKSFNAFWLAAVDSIAVKAPPFSLSSAGKKTITSKQLHGKWTLIDFWGTWCGPCRQEHPEMQQFYDSIIRKATKISLLTIACRDTQKKVSAYMMEKNYSFPVVMSDNKIEHQFFVEGFPTKLLVTPTGKYITVPFNIDWVNFVSQYCDL